MTSRFLFRTTLALLAFSTSSQAMAATRGNCLELAEAQALVAYVLPDIITGVTAQCRTHLTPSDYLIRASSDLTARYRSLGDANWPMARKAFSKMVDEKTLSLVSDDILKGLLTAGLTSAMQGDIKPDDCPMISQIAEALDPLPPANLSKLVGIILDREGRKPKGEGKASKFDLCAAPSSTRATN